MSPNSTTTGSEGADHRAVCVGEFRLDLNLRTLYRGADKINITPKPLGTLEYLVKNRHRVVPKAELLEAVWGGKREISTVEHAIGQLRRAFGGDSEKAQYIETVPGQGYRLVAQVYNPTVPGGTPSQEAWVPYGSEGAGLASEPGAAAHATARRGRRGWWLSVAIGAGLLACLGVALAFHYFSRPVRVARIALNGNTLVAWSAEGSALWEYPFGARLKDLLPGEDTWRKQIVDVDGDGVPEVLVAAPFANPPDVMYRDALFCFSARGKLLWSYRPEIHHGFKGPDLNGPWIFHSMLVVPEGRSSSIWVAVGHAVWWPGFLVRLSPSGAPELKFVSSGQTYALRKARIGKTEYILAGGVNNEYSQASLAIVARDGPPATSPQSEEKYRCAGGCPPGRPYRYILFPRSELNAASDEPYNKVGAIETRPGGLVVFVGEIESDSTYYGFSNDLQPAWVESGDNWGLHRRYEREGRIKHTLENCPERNKAAILRICDENGKWTSVSVPRISRSR